MKKLYPVIFCLVLLIRVSAQPADTLAGKMPGWWVGLSSGVNNASGMLGIHVGYTIDSTTLCGLAAGLGNWGYRASLYLQAHPSSFEKFYYGVGLSVGTGRPEMVRNLELSDGTLSDLTLKLKPVTTLNFVLGNSWKLGRRHRFYLEGGYGLRLTEKNSMYALLDKQVQLSALAKSSVNLMAPGGFILGTGISFGIHSW